MGKWLLMTVLLLSTTAFGAAYKWVDETGQVHYSDRPMPGAEQIQLPATPAARQPAQEAAPSPTGTPDTAPEEQTDAYRSVRITRPTQQATLWNIEGNLDVQVAVSPRLRPGHRVAVNLDGGLVDLRPLGLSFQVPNVFRGLHTLEAVVLDARGEVVIRSESVTFMVQQTSILNPQRARRPPAPAG